jgi:hypothetical protein
MSAIESYLRLGANFETKLQPAKNRLDFGPAVLGY